METVVKNNMSHLDKSTAKVVIFLASNEMTKSKVNAASRGLVWGSLCKASYAVCSQASDLQAGGVRLPLVSSLPSFRQASLPPAPFSALPKSPW